MDAKILLTRDGVILDVNPSASIMFGYHHEEWPSLNMTNLVPENAWERILNIPGKKRLTETVELDLRSKKQCFPGRT